jgi:phosphoribosylcarboxyaminoimidazole (NCAIR) mutase
MSPSNEPRVAILIGSDSDLPVMSEAARILRRLDVPFELEVTSAHRSPERTVEIVRSAPERGVRVFVVGAGSAAHLAGVVSGHTTLPVLGVPLASSDLKGLDANAAWLAASILALNDAGMARRLTDERKKMADGVARKSEAAQETLSSLLSS